MHAHEQLQLQKAVSEKKWPIYEYWDALWWVKTLTNWPNISEILVFISNETIRRRKK